MHIKNLRTARLLLLFSIAMNFVLLGLTLTSHFPSVEQRIIRSAYGDAIVRYQIIVEVLTFWAVVLLSIEIRRNKAGVEVHR